MQFDQAGVKLLNADITAALEAVAAKHGIKFKSGRGSYDPAVGSFSKKVEFLADDHDRKEFDRYAEMFGLKPEDFGAAFKSGARTFTISGINPRASKRPIFATAKDDGKTYVFPSEVVARAVRAA